MTEIAALRRITAALREAVDVIEHRIDQLDGTDFAAPDSRAETRVATVPEAPIPDHELLTVEQVAERLRLKPVTLMKFVRRIRFPAIRGGDGLLFTQDDFIILRDARRPRPRQFQHPSLTTAAASSADVERRLAKSRAAYSRKRSGSSAKRSAAAPADAELQKLRDEYWPKRSGSSGKTSGRIANPDVERRVQELMIENSGKYVRSVFAATKGKSPKPSSLRRGRVVPFPGGKET